MLMRKSKDINREETPRPWHAHISNTIMKSCNSTQNKDFQPSGPPKCNPKEQSTHIYTKPSRAVSFSNDPNTESSLLLSVSLSSRRPLAPLTTGAWLIAGGFEVSSNSGDAAGGRSNSTGSSYTGNGAPSFRMGFGRLFGCAGGTRGAGNMHLNHRRFSRAGNRELWTFHFWFKAKFFKIVIISKSQELTAPLEINIDALFTGKNPL